MAEQRTLNPQVLGSNPRGRTPESPQPVNNIDVMRTDDAEKWTGAGGLPVAASECVPPMDVLSAVLGNAEWLGDRPAVKDLEREISYADLADEIRRVATGIANLGVGVDSRVVLLIGNSVDFVVAALACNWVGAMFVPVSVSDPIERQAAIISDCEPHLVILADQTGDFPGGHSVISYSDLARPAADFVAPTPRVGRLAYAIYTSGTTGSPKGAMISSAAFASSVAEIGRIQPVNTDTRALCVSPVHFDGSFSTIFPTLYYGGLLVIPQRSSLAFPRAYFSALARYEIDSVSFSPSFLRLLLTGRGLSGFANSSLRVVALGGEAASCSEVKAIWDVKPSIRVINRYGPTETTITVSDFELTPELLAGGYVPIGGPHRGTSFHLLKSDGTPVSTPGEAGELYIGGGQLMDSYWKAPELTTSVLRCDIVPGEVTYKTGDLLRLDERGHYAFLGRADRVVKRSGIRLSLVEVAEELTNLTGVQAAATVTFDNEGTLGVAAFVVVDTGVDHLDVRDRAAAVLPTTMLPDRIIVVAELPLGTSSKVDERRLLRESRLAPWPLKGIATA